MNTDEEQAGEGTAFSISRFRENRATFLVSPRPREEMIGSTGYYAISAARFTRRSAHHVFLHIHKKPAEEGRGVAIIAPSNP